MAQETAAGFGIGEFEFSKLKTLAEGEGYDSIMALLTAATFDSLVPGICVNPSCSYTTEIEPDSGSGWCEHCNSNTVKSALVLGDIIAPA